MNTTLFRLTLLALCSAASPLAAQFSLVNGDFSSAITNNTGTVTQASTVGVWNAISANGNPQVANWTQSASTLTGTPSNAIAGYNGSALGRAGNNGAARQLIQVMNGAPTGTGDYAFNFDLTVVDGSATATASLSYQVWGVDLNGTGTFSMNVAGGQYVAPTTSSGTISNTNLLYLANGATATALVNQTMTLGSASSNGTSMSSITRSFMVDQTYDRYLVVFSMWTGTSAVTPSQWGQAQTNNFAVIDNLTISAVPEPSSAAALAGVAALGAVAWRRRRVAR